VAEATRYSTCRKTKRPGAWYNWQSHTSEELFRGTIDPASRTYIQSRCREHRTPLHMHISNAGLGNLNPGVNTVQVRLGLGRFFSGGKR
jgi:hypothetical protein